MESNAVETKSVFVLKYAYGGPVVSWMDLTGDGDWSPAPFSGVNALAEARATRDQLDDMCGLDPDWATCEIWYAMPTNAEQTEFRLFRRAE